MAIEEEAVWASALLRNYVDEWYEDDWKRNWLSVERNFDVPRQVPDCGVLRLRGKRDGVYALSRHGAMLHETKTSSRFFDDPLEAERRLGFDFQTQFYLLALWAEEEVLGKRAVEGVQFDYIRTPNLRQRKNEGRTAFLQRIVEDIGERRDFYFRRWEVTFAGEDLVRFSAELDLKLADIVAWYSSKAVQRTTTYRNETSCFGLYNCPMVDHCGSGDFVGYDYGCPPFPELEEPPEIIQKVISDARKVCKVKRLKKASG